MIRIGRHDSGNALDAVEIEPRVTAVVVELATPQGRQDVAQREPHSNDVGLMDALELVLGLRKKIEGDFRVHMMRCVEHDVVKEEIYRAGEDDADGALKRTL